MTNDEAIEMIRNDMKLHHDSLSGEYRKALRMAISALSQPQRKMGEWIEDGYNHYKAVCSECGEPCATYIMGKPRDRFCKWCGADMRGEEDV